MNQPNSSKTASSERKSSLDCPLTIASLALAASLIEWVMYVYTAHFSFATLLTRHGDKFNLPMRLAMSAWHVFEVYYVPMLGVVLVVTYLFLVLGKKDRMWAKQAVITVSTVLVFFVQTVFLMTLFDLLPYINSASP